MKTPAKIMIAILLAAGIFAAGYMANRHADPSAASASTKQVPSYTCPMHPQYRSDHTGDCPICGMRLEPADAGKTANGVPDDSDHTGLVQISANKQQLMGVRTDEVKQDAKPHMLRVPGRITVDDQRLYRILAATDGWIAELGQNTVGRFVKKDQILASYYTRELLSAERLFLLSIPANEPMQSRDFSQASIRTAGSANPQFPIDSLRGLGMNEIQIEELQKTRTSMPHVHIYSPVSGFVVLRNISPNQRFEKGDGVLSHRRYQPCLGDDRHIRERPRIPEAGNHGDHSRPRQRISGPPERRTAAVGPADAHAENPFRTRQSRHHPPARHVRRCRAQRGHAGSHDGTR